jgi:uncharacterized protein (TIGR02300 family)
LPGMVGRRGEVFSRLAHRLRGPQSRVSVSALSHFGTKRLCADCGAKFYDLNHSPITCPKCSKVFEAVPVNSRLRAEVARAPVRKIEPVVDAESHGQQRSGEVAEEEEGVERNDKDDLGDVPLIDESEEEEADARDIIGGDIKNEERN